MMRAFDLETGTKALLGRKGYALHPDNHVVLLGWTDSTEPYAGQYRYYGKAKDPDGWLADVLPSPKELLCGFNIRFDLMYAIRPGYDLNYKLWREWVAAGGRLWDCQLAEYLLNGAGREHQWLSLDEVSPRYGGNVKIDEVKLLWGQGVDTQDIDPGLLKDYLLGRETDGAWEHGDLGNTLLIAKEQVARAKADGCFRKIMACDMAALVGLLEMERNGECLDMDKGLARAAYLRGVVEQQQAALHKYIAGYPGTFSWRSRFHRSALFFGGAVKYTTTEYQNKAGEWKLHEPWPEGQQAYSQCTVKVPTGDVYKNGKNQGLPKFRNEQQDDLSKPKKRAATALYEFPRQLEPNPDWAASEPGVWSTSSEVIADIKDQRLDVPFLQDYTLLNDVLKDLSTYYITGEPGAETGMLTMVNPYTGYVHPNFGVVGTVTTRLTCDSPTLMNLPRASGGEGEYVSEVKALFVSRFPGGTRGQFDFSALESHVGAYLAQAPQLLADLEAGLDMHILRAAGSLAIPYEQAIAEYRADPKGPWKERRQIAKVTGFRKDYGAMPESTAKHLKIPLENVQAIYDAEAERYPEILQFNAKVQAAVESSAEPTGKHIPHPAPECAGVIVPLLRGYYRGPDGQLFSFTSAPASPRAVKRGKRTSFRPTELKNYPTQGTGASFVKAALGVAVKEIYKRPHLWGTVLLTTTVHDSITADFAGPAAEQEGMTILRHAFTRASAIMKALGVHVPFPVPAEGETGPSLGELGKWSGSPEANQAP